MLNSTTDQPSVDEAPVLHVDLDAFFASVEILDDPSLVGKPVAVGGAGERGVIASASYEARRYGVRSAMPSVVARRVCPDLLILPGRFDRYEEYSRRFHTIVRDFTPNIEPLGLDEVFADLRSLRRLQRSPVELGHALAQRISSELGLLCGVGLGRNKLFAKVASKLSKPSVVNGLLVEGPGVYYMDPQREAQWLDEAPVRALWGVGPATAAKLDRLGLRFVRDLAKIDHATLSRHVGAAMAVALHGYANGEDQREVESNREGKSLGHEETFAVSIANADQLTNVARRQSAVVARALRAHRRVARTISIVVRYDDLSSMSRSQTLPFGVDDEVAIFEVAAALVDSVELQQNVRLFGVHASSFLDRDDNSLQLSFGLDGGHGDARNRAQATSLERQAERETLRDVVDDIRRKFGRSALATASELGADGVDIAVQRGRSAFGPDPTGPSSTER